MTRKYLIEWYERGDITYSEKERLNKIGVGDHDRGLSLQDLKQILNCENWAKESSEIRNKLTNFFSFLSKIKKITFFTPNFNDSKPDASNYSGAIVTDGINGNWVIVYRPSYVRNIQNDVFIQRIDVEFRSYVSSSSYLSSSWSLNTGISFLCIAFSRAFWL